MLNKILSVFGLMKIKRARNIIKTLVRFDGEALLKGIKKDFGRQPVPNAIDNHIKWFLKEFDECLKLNTDNVIASNKGSYQEDRGLNER